MNKETIVTEEPIPTVGPPNLNGQGQDSTSALGVAVQIETETYSDVNWEFILFSILWIVAILLLFAIGFLAYHHNKKRHQEVHQGDVEKAEQEEQDNGEQTSPEVAPSTAKCCQTSPYQCSMIISSVTALIAFILSIFPHTTCSLYSSVYHGESIQSFGLWRVSFMFSGYNEFLGMDVDEGLCYSHFRKINYYHDTALVAARLGATFATVMGGLGMLCLFYYTCCTPANRNNGRIRLLWPVFLLTAIGQAITFSAKGSVYCSSADDCSMQLASVSALTAVIYWFVCIWAVSLLPLD